METILDKLKHFISNYSTVLYSEISEHSRLEADLGVHGDDALELILAYSKRFNVDISRFNALKYIAPEDDTLFTIIVRFFTRKRKPRANDLTVADLERGIIARKLDHSVIINEF